MHEMDYGGTPFESAAKRRSYHDGYGVSTDDGDTDLMRRRGSESLKVCKKEEDEHIESADTTFSLFASLLDSGLQGT